MFSSGGRSGRTLPGAVRRQSLTGVNLKRIVSAALCTGLLLGGGAAAALPAQAATVKTATTKAAKTKVVTKTKITAQPKSVGAVKGSTVVLSATAVGEGLKYQWYKKTPSGKWSTTGAKAPTLTLKNVDTGKFSFRVAVTGSNGEAVSSEATVTVREAYKPVITKLSASSTATDTARLVTITGTRFDDVTQVLVAGKSAPFKKVDNTRIDVTVPARAKGNSGDDSIITSITVASAAGKSTKGFSYIDYFRDGERKAALDRLSTLKAKIPGGIHKKMLAEYDAAAEKLKKVSLQSDANDQIARANAIAAYSQYMWELEQQSKSHSELKASYDAALLRGDRAAAADIKLSMEKLSRSIDVNKKSLVQVLNDLRAYGIKY